VWRFLQNPKGLTFTACKEPVNTFAREQYTVQGDGGSVMRMIMMGWKMEEKIQVGSVPTSGMKPLRTEKICPTAASD